MTLFQHVTYWIDEWLCTDANMTDAAIHARFPGASVRITPNVTVELGGQWVTGRLVTVTG